MKAREHHRCCRCGVPAPRGQWHHRRTRSVIDSHTHCSCNGVWLCATCHRWVHANPVKAREDGFIVSRFTLEPASRPVSTVWGVRWHTCDGTFLFVA